MSELEIASGEAGREIVAIYIKAHDELGFRHNLLTINKFFKKICA